MSGSDVTDLRDKTFQRSDMTGARFVEVRLNDVKFESCQIFRAVMRGVEVLDTRIDGEIQNLVINGVDVGPLVDAELDRRYPDRPKFRPTTSDGFRDAWVVNERLWGSTIARARRLPPQMLHESVEGEWSFIQTLRHLAFATESWVGRCILGDPSPWHPLSLPWDQMSPRPGVPHDRDACPSLDEALDLRLEAMALVRQVLEDLTDERLDSRTEPLVGAGWPDEGKTFPVRECLLVVLNEEWWHRMYAERDLAVIEGKATGQTGQTGPALPVG